jgi:SAM-dependent methyltransferase
MSRVAPSETSQADVATSIARYYTAKIRRHGATPRGVDWTCLAVQELRFVQLLKICEFSAPFSLNDIGCGYGALLAYIEKRHAGTPIDYLGIDLSSAMIAEARVLWRGRKATRFAIGSARFREADIAVASGIFNVKLDYPVKLWERWVAANLGNMSETSRLGFAANFMAPAKAANSPVLYRPSAGHWIGFCRDELGCEVQLLESYGLREFTILARPKRVPQVSALLREGAPEAARKSRRQSQR